MVPKSDFRSFGQSFEYNYQLDPKELGSADTATKNDHKKIFMPKTKCEPDLSLIIRNSRLLNYGNNNFKNNESTNLNNTAADPVRFKTESKQTKASTIKLFLDTKDPFKKEIAFISDKQRKIK